jgi:hypothetical protein
MHRETACNLSLVPRSKCLRGRLKSTSTLSATAEAAFRILVQLLCYQKIKFSISLNEKETKVAYAMGDLRAVEQIYLRPVGRAPPMLCLL